MVVWLNGTDSGDFETVARIIIYGFAIFPFLNFFQLGGYIPYSLATIIDQGSLIN